MAEDMIDPGVIPVGNCEAGPPGVLRSLGTLGESDDSLKKKTDPGAIGIIQPAVSGTSFAEPGIDPGVILPDMSGRNLQGVATINASEPGIGPGVINPNMREEPVRNSEDVSTTAGAGMADENVLIPRSFGIDCIDPGVINPNE